MPRLTTALAALLLAAPAAQAALNIDLRSDLRARVFLDDEYVGETPIILQDISPGVHRLGLENPATGEIRTYAAYSPSSLTAAKILWAGFRPGSVAPPDAQSLTAAPMYTMRTGVMQPVPTPIPPPPPPPAIESGEARAKRHTRNTLLGFTIASQVLTKDSRDRKRRRNVGGGLMVLNEVMRRGR